VATVSPTPAQDSIRVTLACPFTVKLSILYGGRSIPVCEDLLGFCDLVCGTRKIDLYFSGPAGDLNLYRSQFASLHPQVELFLNLFNPVVLKAIHGSGSAVA
jgi:hypothetical protein